jgi:PAS domain S-box-containing protein
VRQRRAIIVNDYAAPNPLKKGHPAGHVDISRYLSIPLMDGERIVALAGVANKVQPYDDADARQVVLLLHRMWRLVQQKQASQALTAEIERVHHFQERLIQTSQDGIIANDRDGNIILFNEGAENILGYRQEEVIGIIPVQQIYGPGGARAVKKALHGPTHGGPGRLIHFEAEVINKTGEAIPIEISASLVFEDGEEVAIVGFFRDLRERRALQERVLQAERLAVLGRMAAHIGHEIKNPLMVIGGFARQLLRDKSPDPAKLLEKLHIIADEVARLEEFLVEVGSYARLSEPHKQPGDLNALIKETCRRLEPILQERGLTLHLDLAPDLPTVHFDAGHLRQTVLNVAKNGLEAMGRGGVLTIVSGLQDGRVLVRFKDTGPGIPPEMMARLFTPFATTKPKGSGLGLAISRKIMEAHGGEIILECPPEGGTLVTLGFAPEDEGGDESED